jgi:N-acetylglucosaminyl-diphospho-decaprenol L-rhamnosyltransferase
VIQESRAAFIFVHYRTPDLLARAVDAVQAETSAAGLASELIVVDNGSDPADRERIDALPARCCRPARNLGYAGGVNLGISAAPDADAFIVMNPDVEILPGCLRTLLAALDGRVAVSGPRFFWSHDRSLMLPPSEIRSRRHAIASRLASRGERWARWSRARWRRHARRHWCAVDPLPSLDLSGALLAIRRDAWERAGPFDEAYTLYFEETDWLRRLPRLGLEGRYVPAAAAVHHYAQSANSEADAARWFAESADRFERKHYGAWFPAVTRRLAGRGQSATAAPRLPPDVPAVDLRALRERAQGRLWLEVSPTRTGFPAAATIASDLTWRMPAEIWSHLAPGTYGLRAVDDAGRELRAWSFERRRP